MLISNFTVITLKRFVAILLTFLAQILVNFAHVSFINKVEIVNRQVVADKYIVYFSFEVFRLISSGI